MSTLEELHEEAQAFHKDHALDVALQNAEFRPSAGISRGFVAATMDKNPIHTRIDGFDEVVSPGFLQTCAAIVISRQAVRETDLNSADYHFSLNECEMLAPVVTGLPYRFDARFDAGKLEADVELRNSGGALAYKLHRKLYSAVPSGNLLEQRGELVYEGRFLISGEDTISAFGKLVGSDSSESNLRALAGSSSAVCNAIGEGRLNPIDNGLIAMYSGAQQFYLDASHTLDLHKGINMRLYVADKDKFGKASGKNDSLGLSVVGADDSGRAIYHFNADLSFQSERLVPLMLKRALRSRN